MTGGQNPVDEDSGPLDEFADEEWLNLSTATGDPHTDEIARWTRERRRHLLADIEAQTRDATISSGGASAVVGHPVLWHEARECRRDLLVAPLGDMLVPQGSRWSGVTNPRH